MIRRPPRSTPFPTRRSSDLRPSRSTKIFPDPWLRPSHELGMPNKRPNAGSRRDRKSTRLNSSHSQISYAVFCLKKKDIDAYACIENGACRMFTHECMNTAEL